MKKNSILKRLISIKAIAATFTLGTLIPAQGVYANAPPPPRIHCNAWQSGTAVANSGNAIKNFNGYNNWDSMTEILNWDGRQERFWLDRVPDQPYGKIRTTYALSQCTGFAWSAHQDFAGGLAKEMVVARLSDGRLIVVHIGTDDAIYWRSQLGAGTTWSIGWGRKEGIYRNLRVESSTEPSSSGEGLNFYAEQRVNNTSSWLPNFWLKFKTQKFSNMSR